MLTVKFLKECLSKCPDNMALITSNGCDIIHISNTEKSIILSNDEPLGSCYRCGNNVFPERELDDYVGICPSCNENLFAFEIVPKGEESNK